MWRKMITSACSLFVALSQVPSLQTLWDGNRLINMVTTRMLLQHRAGLQDYDDQEFFSWTMANPTLDRSPLNLIYETTKDFLWVPGQGGAYSGIGYVLAGLVLSATTNVESWDKLDQQGALVTGQCEANAKNNTWCATEAELFSHGSVFATHGTCASYPNVIHQYACECQNGGQLSLRMDTIDTVRGVHACRYPGRVPKPMARGDVRLQPI